MPRPPKWNSPTESVRLPSHAIEACINLARAMDQPLPAETTDPEFAEYMDFVRNLKPHLVNLTDRHGVRRYLIRCDQPPTFEEWKVLKQVEARLYQRCQQENINPLLVFSELVTRVFKPMKEAG